jgi:hypothetical protein
MGSRLLGDRADAGRRRRLDLHHEVPDERVLDADRDAHVREGIGLADLQRDARGLQAADGDVARFPRARAPSSDRADPWGEAGCRHAWEIRVARAAMIGLATR